MRCRLGPRVLSLALLITFSLYYLSVSLRLLLIPMKTETKDSLQRLPPWRQLIASGLAVPRKENERNFTGNVPIDLTGQEHLPNDKLALQNKGSSEAGKSDDFQKVRVLCWVMTSPFTLKRKALHVKQTWGPRCDKTLYMSTQPEPTFPATVLNVKEGRPYLYNKSKAAFKYVYDHHFHDADWFIKADDDTYIIVENLRYFLRDKNSSEPVYYGHNFKFGPGYMSGGGGYVLSKEALRRFGTRKSSQCTRHHGSEDLGMGECLKDLGVIAGDSRDSLNRSRFLPLDVKTFINQNMPKWYHSYKKYNDTKGSECCSDYLITCHYVDPGNMHLLDYVVYHLRPANRDISHVYKIGNNKTLPI